MRILVYSLFLFTLLATAFSLSASAGKAYTNPDYGFKINPPNDWLVSSEDSFSTWVIAKYLAKKDTYYNSPEGWTWRFKSQMIMVGFVHDVIKGKQVETEEDEDGELVSVSFSNPYKDYKDYLQRTYSGGGFYFSSEKESKVKDIPVTCYEIKVEKLTNTGPRLLIAWVYHLEDADIAVQFEVLEKAIDKQKPDIMRCLKSFRVVERTGELPTGKSKSIVSRVNWDKLPAGERANRRMALETEAHEKALKDLPKGWKHSKVGKMLVLDNYKPKLAKEIARHCQAIMKWLDKNFDYIGPDEYVRAPIIKVYKANDPYSISFHYGSLLDKIEINYEHNPNWLQEFNFEQVSRQAMQHWFSERDRDLYWAMPYWLQNGIEDLFQNCRSKSSKLEFPKDVRDRVDLKQAYDKGTLTKPEQLMMMDRETFYSGRFKNDEASALVRFLLIGSGSKNKKTKNILRDYIQNLADITEEIKEEVSDSGRDDKPTTEEEEDEYFKKQQGAWKEKENEILQETFNRTFAGWDEKDWKAVTTAYMRTIK
jgi:hypothetical protein